MSKHSLEVKKKFKVSAATIYDAWLDPESIKLWLCPGPGVTVPNPVVDAKVGGAFQFDMQVGEQTLPHFGEYKELVKPSKIQFTWNSMNTENTDSLVTILIEALTENSCELSLKHELLPSESSRDDHNGGWTNILNKLSEQM